MTSAGLYQGGGTALAGPNARSTDMEPKKRTCLKCNRPFDSEGPGNRICRRCRQINDRMPRLTEAQMQMQRGAKRHNGELMDPPGTERPGPSFTLLQSDQEND
jgi:hypothetical protein